MNEIAGSVKLLLNVFESSNLGLGFFEVQTTGVIGIELGEYITLCLTLLEELVVVETTVISRYAIKVAHVFRLGAFFVYEECLIHLLTMVNADNLKSSFLPPKSSQTASS